MSLVGALRWIDHRIADFSVTTWSKKLDDESFWAGLKATAELVHAGDFLVRTRDPQLAAVGIRWISHGWEQVACGGLHRELLTDSRLLPVILTWVPFHVVGHVDSEIHAMITTASRAATLSPVEWTFVVPALEILGVECPTKARSLAAQRSVLLRAGGELTQDEQYILAHECFYATSWGRHVANVDTVIASDVRAALSALTMRAKTNADVDALAELQLAANCLQCDPDPQAFEILDAACTADGNVVSRVPLVTRQRRFVHPTLTRTYHTTLASIMAWAAIYSRA